ncbi:hypothetical protein QVD17_30246 [Tagetes erecta]|uniref:RRM domain-containing protein n=1 Tax=Tagetes erecta TaxID=13708 RepID=A0AAD8K167_TARER|nr:hypothetical protein QVD17_30246 [Tagetes erecta]
MEGGWQYPRRRRSKPADKITTTFFITRFPQVYNSQQLWGIFQEFGKVTDVFIPKKKTKGGYVFAFVRFVGVPDVTVLEGKLNTIVLEDRRISANVAHYGQNLRWDRSVGSSNGRRHRVPAIPSKNHLAGIPVSTNVSFKNVLLGDSNKGFRIVEVEAFSTRASKEWGPNALVGDAVNLEALENLRRNFDAIGLLEVDFVYRGGLGVLIVFPENVSAAGFAKDQKELWKGWFSCLQLWTGQQINFQRLAWLIIRGIPIHCWDNFVIDRIRNMFGRHSSSYPIWVTEEKVDWCPNLAPISFDSYNRDDEDAEGSVGFEISDFEIEDEEGDMPVNGCGSPEVDTTVEGVGVSRGEEQAGDINDDDFTTLEGGIINVSQSCNLILGKGDIAAGPRMSPQSPTQGYEDLANRPELGVSEPSTNTRNSNCDPVHEISRPYQINDVRSKPGKGNAKVDPHSGRHKTHRKEYSNASDDANSCDSVEEEVLGTITTGGVVGFKVADQARKVRSLVLGEGVKVVNQ